MPFRKVLAALRRKLWRVCWRFALLLTRCGTISHSELVQLAIKVLHHHPVTVAATVRETAKDFVFLPQIFRFLLRLGRKTSL